MTNATVVAIGDYLILERNKSNNTAVLKLANKGELPKFSIFSDVKVFNISEACFKFFGSICVQRSDGKFVISKDLWSVVFWIEVRDGDVMLSIEGDLSEQEQQHIDVLLDYSVATMMYI